MSGRRELLGRELLDAAQIAVFDLADKDFVIYPFDTKGTEAVAAAAQSGADRRRSHSRPPWRVPSAVRPVAASAVFPLSLFRTRMKSRGMGFILVSCPSNKWTPSSIMRLEKADRYAVLAPNDAYGRAVVADEGAIAEHEAEIVRLEYYDALRPILAVRKAIADYDRWHKALLEQRAMLEARDDEVSKQTLKRLEKLDTLGDVAFDAVLLPGRGQQLKAIASLLSFYDVDRAGRKAARPEQLGANRKYQRSHR